MFRHAESECKIAALKTNAVHWPEKKAFVLCRCKQRDIVTFVAKHAPSNPERFIGVFPMLGPDLKLESCHHFVLQIPTTSGGTAVEAVSNSTSLNGLEAEHGVKSIAQGQLYPDRRTLSDTLQLCFEADIVHWFITFHDVFCFRTQHHPSHCVVSIGGLQTTRELHCTFLYLCLMISYIQILASS